MTDPVVLAELVFTPLEDFAAVDELAAEPLACATADGGTVIPAGGFVLVYGDGGAGKTTLVVDGCYALASGTPWLGLIAPSRPLRISIIENDGPRPEFRKKLRRKLEHHQADLDGRIVVLDEPWAKFTFADEPQRRALALTLTEHATDLLVAGPLSDVGMEGGGTLDDIGKFMQLVRSVHDLVEHPFAVLLIHHENRAGRISGAWEAKPDTLVHVSGEGHGRTRVYWQKVRWSSDLHATTTHLLWAEGDSFTVEAKPEITEDTITADLLQAVRENPGASWTRLRQHVAGNATEAAKVRDYLLKQGALVNSAARSGQFNLWHADDPAAPRSEPGTALERLTFPLPDEAAEPTRSTVPSYRGNGVWNGTAQRSGIAVPLVGDEMYPLLLAEAGNHGHITEDEFTELYALHKLVEAAT